MAAKQDPRQIELLNYGIMCAVAAWDKFNHIYPANRKFAVPTIKVSKRMTRCGAACYDTLNEVRLSFTWFTQFPQHYRDVIIPHELAHQVNHNINGPDCDSHGAQWISIMRAYGLPPDIYHKMAAMAAERDAKRAIMIA